MDEKIQILEKIRLDGEIQDLIAKSNDDNVVIAYDGKEITLTAFIKILLDLINARTSPAQATALAQAEIEKLIGGAPENLDTLKEIADYIANNDDVLELLNEALTNKVDKVVGMGLSEANFTVELRHRLTNEVLIHSDIDTEFKEESSNPVANSVVTQKIQELSRLATSFNNGLMAHADKERLDNLHGIWTGIEPPEAMIDGDVFVKYMEGESYA